MTDIAMLDKLYQIEALTYIDDETTPYLINEVILELQARINQPSTKINFNTTIKGI